MRLGVVSHKALLGGAERALLEALEGLAGMGVRPFVLLPARGPLTSALDRLGVRWAVRGYKWWMAVEGGSAVRRIARPLWTALLAPSLARHLRREGCELVYTNTIGTPAGALAAAVAGLPHVWHVHEFGYEHNRLAFDLGTRRSLRLLARWSDAVVFNSKAVASKYAPWLGDTPWRVVYQSVTPEDGETPADLRASSRFRVVTVGSLTEGKGQADVLAAAARLVRDGIDVEVVLVGDGDPAYEADLRRAAEAEPLAGRVRFTGHLDRPFPVIRTAAVVVVPSRFEGFGRVAVEGMLAGRPVVASDEGGLPEIVEHDERGLLFPAGNVEALAACLRRLHADPRRAGDLAERGRAWAGPRFTKDRYAAELYELLEGVHRAAS